MIGAAHIVAQQRRRLVHVDHQDVDVAIVIEVAECHAADAISTLGYRSARNTGRIGLAHRICDVMETATCRLQSAVLTQSSAVLPLGFATGSPICFTLERDSKD